MYVDLIKEVEEALTGVLPQCEVTRKELPGTVEMTVNGVLFYRKVGGAVPTKEELLETVKNALLPGEAP